VTGSAGAIRATPIGGTGEIGKNMYMVELDGRIVVIDCGVKFPTPDQLGVDLVLPDFEVLEGRLGDIEALILTHGHEDHIGGVPYFLKTVGRVPIMGTRFTLGLVKSKLDEHRIKDAELIEIAPSERHQVGPFEAEFIRVTHSIPDCVAVALRSPSGTVVHTGDFKFDHAPIDDDPTDVAALSRLGDEGVLLLMSDSTNAEVPGSVAPERTVGTELRRQFASAPGRVVLTCFSSHIHRVQQVLDAAHHDGRYVALVGRSLLRNFSIAVGLGIIRVPGDVVVNIKSIDDRPDDELVIVTTGSQGEPLSGLRRMAYGDHQNITIRPGDTVIFSSRIVPGNELAVNETINKLVGAGARIVSPESAAVHVSGHAHSDELRLMLRLVRPKFFAPIHGELRHQKAHADIARTLGVTSDRIFLLANGNVLQVDQDSAAVVEKLKIGLIYVDGLGMGDVADGILRDRRHLSEDGLVLIVATLSANDGLPIGEVDVITRGFAAANDELIAATKEEVEKTLNVSVTEIDMLHRLLHDAVASLMWKRVKQRPLILPVIVEV
jgi:ribonuclease J